MIAVSGGMDSVVLLDLLAAQIPQLVVAHFNHGTRSSADADAAFVKNLAAHYHLPFIEQKVSLGASVGEAEARQARYAFLESVADGGPIYTAHHLDDLLESIAINLLRGTGWRGLTPFWRNSTIQPFLRPTEFNLKLPANLDSESLANQLAWSRREIAIYAAWHHLTWRQDPTNYETHYLRNRLRPAIQALPSSVKTLVLDLYRQQCNNRREIEHCLQALLLSLAVPTPNGTCFPREFFTIFDDPNTACELLRAALAFCGLSATRPQIADFYLALRTFAPGKKFNLPHDQLVLIRRHDFLVPTQK